MTANLAMMIAFIIAGMVLFALEVVTPSFGLLAATGIAALAAAVWRAFAISSLFGLIMIIALAITMPAYLVFLVRLLPKTPLGRRLFLRPSPKSTGDAAPEAEQLRSLVGKRGEAVSLLRPCGAVRIDGQRVVAVAESGMIERGTTVEVIRAAGQNVIVRPCGDQDAAGLRKGSQG